MRIALLGPDDDAFQLAHWAVEHDDAELVAVFDAGGTLGNWEDLLTTAVDVVIVGSARIDGDQPDGVAADERRSEQLRKLLQEGVPIVAVHPCCDTLLAYEIDLACRDQGRIVVPYHAGLRQPLFDRLLEVMRGDANSSLGMIEQVVVECLLVDRDRGLVLREFTRALPLLRMFLGGIQKLAATGPVTEAMVDPLGPKRKQKHSLANLLVTLTGTATYAARWSVGPAIDDNEARLVVIGTRGRAVLTMPALADWQLSIDTGEKEILTCGRQEEYAAVWNDVRQMLAGERSAAPVWTAVCHDMDVVEAIDRSIQRGRTIELLAEEQTEEDSFKGVMAVGGCLTLAAVLGFVFLAAVVEGLKLPMREWAIWQRWPVFVLVAVVSFLVLQLLRFIVRPRSGTSDTDLGDVKNSARQ